MLQRRKQPELTPYVSWKPTRAQADAGIAALEIEQPVKREKVKRKNGEFVLQCSAVKQLRAMLPPDYVVTSWCAERSSMSEGSKSRMQGQLKGWPDTGIFGDGMCWLLEWKYNLGALSRDQVRVHSNLKDAGIKVAVCYSIEDAVAFLRATSARFRGRIAA